MKTTIIDFIQAAGQLPNGRVKMENNHEYEVEITKSLRGYYVAALNEYIDTKREHVVAFEYGATKSEALYKLRIRILIDK